MGDGNVSLQSKFFAEKEENRKVLLFIALGMMLKKKQESTIVERYTITDKPVETTKDFVKQFLNPTPDRYDMTYRFEHTLRVAQWGKKIGYDKAMSVSICKAIDIHDKWNDVPADATAFELSVRDADDLERFDVMRICMLGRSDIGERNANELIEICDKRLAEIEDSYKRKCGTETARKFWEEELVNRKQFYEELKRQMEGTWAV